MVRINPKETTKPKRLTDKEMRELLLSLKKRADKAPAEADSFSLEVICSFEDINKSQKHTK